MWGGVALAIVAVVAVGALLAGKSSNEAAEPGEFDLLAPPHDDIALCEVVNVEPLVAHLGGAQTASIPGSDAATIEKFANELSTFPLVGICELTLPDGVTRYQVAIADYREEAVAASELATRVRMIEEVGGPSPVSVPELQGAFIDTGLGIVGHLGRYGVSCGPASANANGWASTVVREDCITIVMELTDLVSRSRGGSSSSQQTSPTSAPGCGFTESVVAFTFDPGAPADLLHLGRFEDWQETHGRYAVAIEQRLLELLLGTPPPATYIDNYPMPQLECILGGLTSDPRLVDYRQTGNREFEKFACHSDEYFDVVESGGNLGELPLASQGSLTSDYNFIGAGDIPIENICRADLYTGVRIEVDVVAIPEGPIAGGVIVWNVFVTGWRLV